jgi:tetratricopeptide (TPR) repeat protein
VILLLPAWATSEPALDPEEVSDLFSRGKGAFRRAMETLEEDPQRAAALFDEAAAAFMTIVEQGGIRNGRLYYNIGNCHYQRGDVGRAILAYRRAQRFMPSDAHLRENLHAARALRRDRVETQIETRLLETLLFWHYGISPRTKAIVALVAYLLGFAALLTWLALLGRRWLRLALACFWMCAIVAGSAGVDAYTRAHLRDGVIVAPETEARKGPGLGFAPQFQQPLHAGTEFHLLSERDGWFEVRLADGTETWLPADDAEQI